MSAGPTREQLAATNTSLLSKNSLIVVIHLWNSATLALVRHRIKYNTAMASRDTSRKFACSARKIHASDSLCADESRLHHTRNIVSAKLFDTSLIIELSHLPLA
jgi:hypothetical protein